ncbi:heme exporter protein CcmD [Pararhodospirillum oryzae]|uniref:Heme exporter protein D n=1 Tax=Pararhodospirillum oryzae TaxID=478448 RepID=A0A512H6I1_9PROT|nr:heme exporter protein CcmD [Pararhodospirillum oryzae]GEO81042.1 hypothetical protein ROR02_11730 [Pararhodospirillum oryzae]
MDSLRDFLAMGGYAAFIWPAYGLTFVVLGGLIAHSLIERRRTRALLAQITGLPQDSATDA